MRAAHNPCRPPARPLQMQVADLISEGKLKLEIALSVPLAEAAKAHEQVETGHTRGKVVLTL